MSSNRPYLLRAVHEWISDNGLTPYIVIDITRPGVKVPPQAAGDGRLVLNLASRAVARLDIGNDLITCMARFGGVSQSVQVPVTAVLAIYARENGQGMLLADDAPGSVAPPVEVSGSQPQPNAPALQVVPAIEQQDAGDAPADAADGSDGGNPDPDAPRPKGRPTLRVIK